MDEVLADSFAKQLALYNQEFHQCLTKHATLSDEQRQIMQEYPKEPGFFADLSAIPGAQVALKALAERYEIFVVTAAMEFPNSFQEKYFWLARHFPFISWKNIVFCGDKSVVRASILIDDHARNLVSFSGRGLLFSAPHNLDQSGNFERVADWSAALKLLLPKN